MTMKNHTQSFLLILVLVSICSARSLSAHQWALYIYGMNGSDPTVAQMALYDWFRLRKSNPSQDLAVLGLRDLPFSKTRYYQITAEGHETLETRSTNENTGDPQSLYNFLSWASERSPADKTWLLFDGHGTGAVVGGDAALPEDRDFIEGGPDFEGLIGPEPPSGGGLGPGGEERDLLTMRELSAVVSRVKGIKQVELIAFQACQMQNLEALYEMRDSARYFVGSEESMRNHPFPLTDLVRYLSEHPDIDGADFGRFFVEHSFSSTSHRIVTLSCVNSSQLSTVTESVDLLGRELMNLPLWELDEWNDKDHELLRKLVDCTNAAVSIGSGKYVDLTILAKALENWAAEISNPRIARAAAAVQQCVANAVVITESRKKYTGSGGVSIFFPTLKSPGFFSRLRGRPDYEPSELLTQYQRTDFARVTSWDEFIRILAQTVWEQL